MLGFNSFFEPSIRVNIIIVMLNLLHVINLS